MPRSSTLKVVMLSSGMNGVCAGGTDPSSIRWHPFYRLMPQDLFTYVKITKLSIPLLHDGCIGQDDIQPLIIDEALRDLAASIFQAVVNQTVSGLACKPTGGQQYLGVTSSFPPELREASIRTPKLDDEHDHCLWTSSSVCSSRLSNSKKDLDVPLIDMQHRLEGKDQTNSEVDCGMRCLVM